MPATRRGMIDVPATRLGMMDVSATGLGMITMSATGFAMIDMPATRLGMVDVPATRFRMNIIGSCPRIARLPIAPGCITNVIRLRRGIARLLPTLRGIANDIQRRRGIAGFRAALRRSQSNKQRLNLIKPLPKITLKTIKLVTQRLDLTFDSHRRQVGLFLTGAYPRERAQQQRCRKHHCRQPSELGHMLRPSKYSTRQGYRVLIYLKP